MAQFGKNPPWAREMGPGPGMQGLQPPGVATPVQLSQPGVATPTVYSLNSAQPQMQAQHQYSQHQQQMPPNQVQLQQQMQQQVQLQQPPGIAIPTTLATTQVATVSYPTPRAAQQQQQALQQQQQQQQQGGPPGANQANKQRVFTGTVTKLHDNFGFVDEDVFFQSSCVKGPQPKVGDRVLVEATYNANMPFKWNATRIQVLPNQGGATGPAPNMAGHAHQQQQPPARGNVHGGGAAIPPPSQFHRDGGAPPPLMGSGQGGMNRNIPSQRGREVGNFRDRDRDRERQRAREERHERQNRDRRSPKKRSRSPRRSRSPSSRNRSPTRSRRPTRVVPRYSVTIPKLSLDTREANVIALRSRYQNLYIPSDFFNTSLEWTDAFPCHRPFNLANTCSFHVMHKDVAPLDAGEAPLEPSDADHLFSAKVMLLSCPPIDDLYQKSCSLAGEDSRSDFQHPTRLLNFLVGLKGKSEPMAIGGPWSPTLDGPNPEGDPSVLIKTAIRTTRGLTGIDLSKCTQWYRFAEIRYHRPEEVHKGRSVPARVETVVIFLPDVWSCEPSRSDWSSIRSGYRQRLADSLKHAEDRAADNQDEEDEGEVEEKKEPTHYSELDVKTMKVGELRRELDNRSVASKGLRSQLMARLTKALKAEQAKEEEEAGEEEEEKPEVQEETAAEQEEKEEERKKKDEEEKKRREEKDKAARERRYVLPENPAIIVHPSATAKSGRFDCTSMSLSVLLDYRPEDNKEHTFEVSLFAEIFNEMLMRDFGFRIYKSLLAAPEPKKDEKKSDKDSKDKDKKESKDKEEKDKEEEKEKKDKDEDEEDKDGKEPKKKKSRSEDGDDRSDDEDDKKKPKLYTADKDLLLSFSYFDLTHTGYLLDKDTEEIIHTLGLHLSRSQVKKLVQKVLTRDTFNYRKLTDKPVDAEAAAGATPTRDETPAEEEKPAEETMETDAAAAAEEEEESVDEERVGLGNKALLPSLVIRSALLDPAAPLTAPSTPTGSDTPGRRSTRKKKGDDDAAGDNAPAPTMVQYKGSYVDIKSVMQRLEKSEKSRIAVEDKYRELQQEISDLRPHATDKTINHNLPMELSELKRRLREHKKTADDSERNAKRYRAGLEALNKHMSEHITSISKALTDGSPEKSKVKPEVNGEK